MAISAVDGFEGLHRQFEDSQKVPKRAKRRLFLSLGPFSFASGAYLPPAIGTLAGQSECLPLIALESGVLLLRFSRFVAHFLRAWMSPGTFLFQGLQTCAIAAILCTIWTISYFPCSNLVQVASPRNLCAAHHFRARFNALASLGGCRALLGFGKTRPGCPFSASLAKPQSLKRLKLLALQLPTSSLLSLYTFIFGSQTFLLAPP
jgi:hypothetical protein